MEELFNVAAGTGFMKYINTYVQTRLPGLADFGIKVLIAILLYFVGKKVIKLLMGVVCKSFERVNMEETSISFINSLLNAFFYVMLVAMIAIFLGVKETSIAAILGAMGMGIVLSLKESLSNLFGGLILLFMKPFSLGDYIKEDSHGNEGTVIRMDLFYTTMVTVDNKTVSVPNGIVANNSMTNLTRQDKRQLRETVGVSYRTDIKKVKFLLESILEGDEAILQNEGTDVFVSSLGESSVQIGWHAWVKPEDYWNCKWRITEEIKEKFQENQIEIPFNQLDVTIKKRDSQEYKE